jgi:hypothetical protein
VIDLGMSGARNDARLGSQSERILVIGGGDGWSFSPNLVHARMHVLVHRSSMAFHSGATTVVFIRSLREAIGMPQMSRMTGHNGRFSQLRQIHLTS